MKADLDIPELADKMLYFKSNLISNLILFLDIINCIFRPAFYITYSALKDSSKSRMHIYIDRIDSYGFPQTDLAFSYNIYTLKAPTLNLG